MAIVGMRERQTPGVQAMSWSSQPRSPDDVELPAKHLGSFVGCIRRQPAGRDRANIACGMESCTRAALCCLSSRSCRTVECGL